MSSIYIYIYLGHNIPVSNHNYLRIKMAIDEQKLPIFNKIFM